MLVKELLEYRWYGPRPRNKPEAQQEHRNRISKKPTKAKRRYDNEVNAKKRRKKQAAINQAASLSSL
jgi:hypothetical protein